MVGKFHRDTSSVTATPSTVTSSSAAFGRWAFGIGQPRHDRRGRTDIVKGRSVRSGGNVLTTLSCSASGIFAICCDLTRPTITRLARTFQTTRTRRRREQYIPLAAFCLRHFLADFIICMCVFDFQQVLRMPEFDSDQCLGITIPIVTWSTPWMFLGARVQFFTVTPVIETGVQNTSYNASVYNPALFGQSAWDLGNGFGFSYALGTYFGIDQSVAWSSTSLNQRFAPSYTGDGWNLT